MPSEFEIFLVEFEQAIDTLLASEGGAAEEDFVLGISKAVAETRALLNVFTSHCEVAACSLCDWLEAEAMKLDMPELQNSVTVVYADAADCSQCGTESQQVGGFEANSQGEAASEGMSDFQPTPDSEDTKFAKMSEEEAECPIVQEFILRTVGALLYVKKRRRENQLQVPQGPAQTAGVKAGWRLKAVSLANGEKLDFSGQMAEEAAAAALLNCFFGSFSPEAVDSPVGVGQATLRTVKCSTGPMAATFVHIRFPALIATIIEDILRPSPRSVEGVWPPSLRREEGSQTRLVQGKWQVVHDQCEAMRGRLQYIRWIQAFPLFCDQLRSVIVQQPHWMLIITELLRLKSSGLNISDPTSVNACVESICARLLKYMCQSFPERLVVSLLTDEDVEAANALLDPQTGALHPVTLRLKSTLILGGHTLDTSCRLLPEGPLVGAGGHISLADPLPSSLTLSRGSALVFGKDRAEFEIIDRLKPKVARMFERQAVAHSAAGFYTLTFRAVEWLNEFTASAWEFFCGQDILQKIVLISEFRECLTCGAFKRLLATPGLNDLLSELGIDPSSPAFTMLLALAFTPSTNHCAEYTGPLKSSSLLANQAIVPKSQTRALVMSLFPFQGPLFLTVDCVLRVSMASKDLHISLDRDENWVRADRMHTESPYDLMQLFAPASDEDSPARQASNKLIRTFSGDLNSSSSTESPYDLIQLLAPASDEDSPARQASNKLIRTFSGDLNSNSSPRGEEDRKKTQPLSMRQHVRDRVVLTAQISQAAEAVQASQHAESKREQEEQGHRQQQMHRERAEQKALAKQFAEQRSRKNRAIFGSIVVLGLALIAHPKTRPWVSNFLIYKLLVPVFSVLLLCGVCCGICFCMCCRHAWL